MATDARAAAMAAALHDHGLGCWHPGGSGGTTIAMPPCRAFHEDSAASLLAAMPPADWCGHDATIARLRAEYDRVLALLDDAAADRDSGKAEIARLRKIEEAARAGFFAFCDATDKREPCGLSTCRACALRDALGKERR